MWLLLIALLFVLYVMYASRSRASRSRASGYIPLVLVARGDNALSC